MRLAFGVALSILLLGCGGGSGGTGIDVKVRTIEGTVTDTAGAPVTGATVTIAGTDEASNTDASGAFSLTTSPTNGDLILTVTTEELTDSVVVSDVAIETLSVDVQISIDRVRRRIESSNLEVLAKIVGVCDLYFENNRVIRQANRAPQGVQCTAKVWVTANGVPQGGVPFEIQYGGCREGAKFSPLASGTTRAGGAGELQFSFADSAERCVYRIVTPSDVVPRRQIVYEVHTFTRQARKR